MPEPAALAPESTPTGARERTPRCRFLATRSSCRPLLTSNNHSVRVGEGYRVGAKCYSPDADRPLLADMDHPHVRRGLRAYPPWFACLISETNPATILFTASSAPCENADG